MPIWAPRREPADSTVSQERSNTRMYETGPLASERVLLTRAPRGRRREKSYPTPPPRRMVSVASRRAT